MTEWQRGGKFRQTSAQREFAQALGRLMMEQNHVFAAAGLAMMKGDIIITSMAQAANCSRYVKELERGDG